MSKALAELRQRFTALDGERQALLEKEGLTAADVTLAEQKIGEMAGIRQQIELEQRRASLTAQGAGLMEWAGSIPLPGGPVTGGQGGTYGNGVTMLGMVPAGVVEVGRDAQGTHVEELGKLDGNFGARAFAASREPAYHAAWRRMLRHGWHGLSNGEQAALQEGADTAGGYLVPDDLRNQIISKEPTPTRLLNFVEVVTTSRDALAYPKVNYTTDDLYTTGMRVTWTGEIPASATAHRVTEPVFGQVRIPVFTAMMSIPVTNDLIEDAVVDLMGWLSGKFSETYELLRDNMIVNGSGVNQPAGILVNPNAANNPATVNTGAAAALTADGIQSLGWSLPEQYDERGRFVMNKTNTGQALAKLKDGDGRYLWGAGLQDSGLAPPIKGRALLGYDVSFSGFMPNVGANTYPIIFGDLMAYTQVIRLGISIQVLRELYAETNQVLLLARVRLGGLVTREWALKIQKVAA